MVCLHQVRLETSLVERTFSPLVELHAVYRNCVPQFKKRVFSLSGLHVCRRPSSKKCGLIYAMNRYLIILAELTYMSTCLCLCPTVSPISPSEKREKHSLINTRVLLLTWYTHSSQDCSLFWHSKKSLIRALMLN